MLTPSHLQPDLLEQLRAPFNSAGIYTQESVTPQRSRPAPLSASLRRFTTSDWKLLTVIGRWGEKAHSKILFIAAAFPPPTAPPDNMFGNMPGYEDTVMGGGKRTPGHASSPSPSRSSL